MNKKHNPPENLDNSEESKGAASLDSVTPTEKFKALARRVTQVSREELLEQQRFYDAEKKSRKSKSR